MDVWGSFRSIKLAAHCCYMNWLVNTLENDFFYGRLTTPVTSCQLWAREREKWIEEMADNWIMHGWRREPRIFLQKKRGLEIVRWTHAPHHANIASVQSLRINHWHRSSMLTSIWRTFTLSKSLSILPTIKVLHVTNCFLRSI